MPSDSKPALTPTLRFPEFRGLADWEIKPASAIAEVLQGYGFPERHQGKQSGELPFYKVSDISRALDAGSHFIDKAANYINHGTLLELKAKTLPPGTTIFAKIGEALRLNKRAITTLPCVIDNNTAGVKAINGKATDSFLFYLWSNISLDDYAGGVVPAVNKSTIQAIPVSVPSPAEQQKIAECLSTLDGLIGAESQKLDALKALKKGLMQQLFPREGETVPRLRFPEFRSAPEWEVVPLGTIADIKLGKMLDSQKHTTGKLLPYLNNIAVRWNAVDTINLPEMYFDDHELDRFGLKAGDVVVCEGGEPGRSAVWDGRLPGLKFQKAIHRVRFNVPFEPHLLVQYLEAIAGTPQFEKLFTGGGIKHLTRETFAKLEVPLVSEAEQHRIAACLSSLDALIAAQNDRLSALKTHKQGLLQSLFPTGTGSEK